MFRPHKGHFSVLDSFRRVSSNFLRRDVFTVNSTGQRLLLQSTFTHAPVPSRTPHNGSTTRRFAASALFPGALSHDLMQMRLLHCSATDSECGDHRTLNDDFHRLPGTIALTATLFRRTLSLLSPSTAARSPCGLTRGELLGLISSKEINYDRFFFEGTQTTERALALKKRFAVPDDDCLYRCRQCGCSIEEHDSNKTVVQPAFDSASFKFTEYVNRAVNNKDQRAFLERNETIQAIDALAQKAVRNTNNKAWAIVLFSPRGTGKTSVVRFLALNNHSPVKDSAGLHHGGTQFKALGECGRLLVLDWTKAPQIMTTGGGLTGEFVVCAIILWHCMRIFAGTDVSMPYERVAFPSQNLSLGDAARCLSPSPLTINPSFDRLAAKMNSVDSAMQAWKDLTKVAFMMTTDPQPAFLFDTTEELCTSSMGPPHFGGEPRTQFSEIAAAIPQNTIAVWVGTRNTHTEKVPIEATRFYTQRVTALAGLSLDASKEMRNKWGCALSDDAMKGVWNCTCGVPRLLEYALDFPDADYSERQAITRVKQSARGPYTTAFDCLESMTDQDLAYLVLACSVRWQLDEGQLDQKTKARLVPGTTISWSELMFMASVFPTDDGSATFPRYWIDKKRITAMEKHWPQGVRFADLYPDVENILTETPGAVAAGVPFEKLMAAAFAARFHVHCKAHNVLTASKIGLDKLYPSTDPHVQAVLQQFDICLHDGIQYPTQEVFASATPTSRAVVVNVSKNNAHHDILLPVTRRADQTRCFVAVQLRFGHLKDASELHNQMFCEPGGNNEVAALLQVCSKHEGKQIFRSIVYANFQQRGKFAVIDGAKISKLGDLLEVYAK